MKMYQQTRKIQLQFQVRGPLQSKLHLQLQFEYTAGRTGNFGANCWGGFAVHREVIAPHGGYMTNKDFPLKTKKKNNEIYQKPARFNCDFK